MERLLQCICQHSNCGHHRSGVELKAPEEAESHKSTGRARTGAIVNCVCLSSPRMPRTSYPSRSSTSRPWQRLWGVGMPTFLFVTAMSKPIPSFVLPRARSPDSSLVVIFSASHVEHIDILVCSMRCARNNKCLYPSLFHYMPVSVASESEAPCGPVLLSRSRTPAQFNYAYHMMHCNNVVVFALFQIASVHQSHCMYLLKYLTLRFTQLQVTFVCHLGRLSWWRLSLIGQMLYVHVPEACCSLSPSPTSQLVS